jgi:Cd2+/Zn2+-exporting ATPase
MTTGGEKQQQETFAWTIGGMDCAGCAAKITKAVERIPGVSEVKVSVMAETLTAKLQSDPTIAEKLEKQVRALGYKIESKVASSATTMSGAAHQCCGGHDYGHAHDHGSSHSFGSHGAGHDHGAMPKQGVASANPSHGFAGHVHGEDDDAGQWYQSAKGRLVLVSGVLLAAAWGLNLLVSERVGYAAFLAACLVGVIPVARRAISAARAGIPFTIEMLMTIAVVGALFIGAAEEAALVVFLFAVGEVLEGVATNRARDSIRALADLMPTNALVISEDGSTRETEAASLEIGQTVLVRPGDRIPADGAIIEGESSINEAPVTGESMPRSKGVGQDVFAGSINVDAVLKVRVLRAAADNTIARIIRLVEEAQEAKAPTERFIDRFSRIYMPAIVGVAALVALVPPLAFGGEWSVWIYRALALLLIGCPCALVISVPASIASALSVGARHGLLMKGGVVMENAARTQWVTFDKTGTLTAGKPRVTDVVPFDVTEDRMIAIAAAVEAGSSHPLAEAILQFAKDKAIAMLPSKDSRAVVGKGVVAEVEGISAQVISPRHATEQKLLLQAQIETAGDFEKQGKTAVVVVHGGKVVGLIAMRDEPRNDAKEAVAELKALGIQSIMLTGDNQRTGKAIAGALGMDVRTELMPDDKVREIRRIAESESVMMVGDGINDAPALAAATVGAAMGSGTQVALETADAALLRSNVRDVPRMIRLARAAMANIRTNIWISLVLKAVFLVTSILGYTGLWVAILADTGATVLVTLNALRLLRFNPDAKP